MGCGTGELTHRLQEFVGNAGLVVGVDTSQNMVRFRVTPPFLSVSYSSGSLKRLKGTVL